MQVVSPPHPAELSEALLLQQCQVERGRGSGPGGQHRNKVETAIRMRHEPTGVMAGAGERREQIRNRQVAAFRLRINLALQVRSERDLTTGPSDRWRSRLIQPKGRPPHPGTGAGMALATRRFGRLSAPTGRIACNPDHDDFPALLAEALDVLWLRRWDPKIAAAVLEVSASQLVKFIAKEPAALVLVNAQRHERGQHPLKT